MSTPQHRLTEVDREARKAVCAVCGPVAIWRDGGTRVRCSTVMNRRPSRLRSSDRKVRPHGMTTAEARAHREGKECEICGRTDTLNVDHDHETGRRRGVLCSRHNMTLGFVDDSIEVLEALISYLKKYS